MTRTGSHIEEVNALFPHMLPTHSAAARASDRRGAWEQTAMKAIGVGHIESADEVSRFDDAVELRAPDSAMRFDDRRCPVCGGFGCGGC